MQAGDGAAPCGASGRRVLLFGWGAAAEAVLRELAGSHSAALAALLCISHGQQAGDCDLREVCAGLGFACELSDSDEQILGLAGDFAPDLIVSASYRRKISGSVLRLCADCINFHPSLLPKHRGCWSGFWAIFEGDAETGVTCHRMVEAFDRGHILHQERLAIDSSDTSFSLYKRLLPVTGACAKRVFSLYFGSGLPEGSEQEGPASYHYRKLPFGGAIQAEWADEQVERFIRAMHFPPFEGAVALVGGERVEVESLSDYRRVVQSAAVAAAPAAAAATAVAAAVAAGAAAGAPMECAAKAG